MGVREQLIRDCKLLGDFAVKSVETMKAGDEKGVVRLYTGASQANVLMLLTELVDYLAECSSPEDFPEMLRGYASAQSLKKRYYE